MAKTCENEGCDNVIDVASLDCPGQCHRCAQATRARIAAFRRVYGAGTRLLQYLDQTPKEEDE